MSRQILALLAEPRLQRAVLRVLGVTRARLALARDLDEFVAALDDPAHDLAVLDGEGFDVPTLLGLLARAAGRRPRPLPLILLAGRLDAGPLATLLGSGLLGHLVARGEPFDPAELLVPCEKLLRDDYFGLEKHLAWGVRPDVVPVQCSADRPLLLDRLATYLDGLHLPSRLPELVCGIADELLMNALYDAPVDASGAHPFAPLPRSQAVQLPPGQSALCCYGCDGRTLALSVRDPFGSLPPGLVAAHLGHALRREAGQISDKPGGAGMGLYFIFLSASQLVVNLSPGRATEVIALLDVSGNFRSHAARPKSLHLFVADPAPAGGR